MRVVLQRVKKAHVDVDGNTIGKVQKGLLVFVGFTHTDREDVVRKVAKKCVELRIFEDKTGKMNKSIIDVQGEILSISQFTLYGNCRKGRRPSFTEAASKDIATPLYNLFNDVLRSYGVHIETGEFGSDMKVTLLNDGPITMLLDSDEL